MGQKIRGICTLSFGIITFIATIVAVPNENLRYIFLFLSGIIAIAGLLSWSGIYLTACYDCHKVGIAKIGDEDFIPSKRLYKKIVNAKEVKICAVSADMLLLHNTQLFSDALTNNVIFKLLIATPHSELVEFIEKVEGPDREGAIDPEIKNAIALARGYNTKHHGGRIEVRHYPSSAFRSCLILCDNQCGIITLLLHIKRSRESIKIELFKKEKGLLDDCIKYFDSCWQLSMPLK